MPKVLLPVDGSDTATRAAQRLVDMAGWCKGAAQVDLLAVHAPVPKLPGLGKYVSDEMLQRYYDDECISMLAPARALLDAAGVRYAVHTRVGAIAESIVEQAKQSQCDMIFMGTRGATGLANMVLGSVAMRVLHLADVPVVLVR
jgi:nucleotide-binding universal stress UspA family protein